MKKINCWEFMRCGREPEGSNVSRLGICPVTTFVRADGFCEGTNGGRACAYLSRIYDLDCNASRRLSLKDVLVDKKTHRCENCNFYEVLKNEHGEKFSLSGLKKYLTEKQ